MFYIFHMSQDQFYFRSNLIKIEKGRNIYIIHRNIKIMGWKINSKMSKFKSFRGYLSSEIVDIVKNHE